MVKVKICGITNLKDAKAAIDAGCNALGFVFYKKSPRYISPDKAKAVITKLPSGIIKVGVFVDASEKTIRRIAKLCRLDMLQFHGGQSPAFCARFKGCKVIKAFRLNPVRDTKAPKGKHKISNGIKNRIDVKNVLQYKADAYLFDTFIPSRIGGTGKKFNWNLLKGLRPLKKKIFLAGGLNSGNVKRAIKTAAVDWVDVSTSLEKKPGYKDHRKIKDFMEALKGL